MTLCKDVKVACTYLKFLSIALTSHWTLWMGRQISVEHEPKILFKTALTKQCQKWINPESSWESSKTSDMMAVSDKGAMHKLLINSDTHMII